MKNWLKAPTNYRFYIDISGNAKDEDIFVGSILFNEKYRKNFREQFYTKFPNLKNFNDKGTTLKEEKLKAVIDFMEVKRIHMTCLSFTKKKFIDCETLIKNKIKSLINKEPALSHSKERILAILYYYNLKNKANQNYPYEGNVCIESQIKIDKVLSKLSSISQRDNYFFYLSPNWRRLQHMLKFADFVASAGKRLDINYLKSLKYYNFIEPEILEYDLNHVFGYNKLVGDIKNRNLYKQKSIF